MFDELNGLPAHPLLVHAAVVFVPLFAILAIAFVVLPFLRSRLNWIVVTLAIVAPGAAFFAKESGKKLRDKKFPAELTDAVKAHQDHGEKLLWAVCGLALVALFFVALDAASRRVKAQAAEGAAEAPAARGRLVIMIVFGVLVLVGAGLSLWYAYKTGDTGSRMVWG
ncbi:DUF2231 domain-containing protein [Longispora albida]|uniref:DUF2231 domain-containing protein n=1 Tax=Longispora albida TaxID=203523 RepID=UPI0004759D04|nr:DUF2231 domain-containing protein [Longispora albida]